MASSKEYLQFVLEQLSELQEITYRAMMGEFIIYYRGKIVGSYYDYRLLVKPKSPQFLICRQLLMKFHTKMPKKCYWWKKLIIKIF